MISQKIVFLMVNSAFFINVQASGIMEKFSSSKDFAENNVLAHRNIEHDANKVFVSRWSQRAMSGEAVSKEQLMTMFEAARWAPSSYNDQPWFFVYALAGTPEWNAMFDLLVDFNKQWVKDAGALVLVISRDTFKHNGKPNPTHSFDAGAAWENLALQGSMLGLVVHGMGGFDYQKAREVMHIPQGYTIEAMVAVGKPGEVTKLSTDLQSAEKPSDRKPLDEFVFNGSFHIAK